MPNEIKVVSPNDPVIDDLQTDIRELIGIIKREYTFHQLRAEELAQHLSRFEVCLREETVRISFEGEN